MGRFFGVLSLNHNSCHQDKTFITLATARLATVAAQIGALLHRFIVNRRFDEKRIDPGGTARQVVGGVPSFHFDTLGGFPFFAPSFQIQENFECVRKFRFQWETFFTKSRIQNFKNHGKSRSIPKMGRKPPHFSCFSRRHFDVPQFASGGNQNSVFASQPRRIVGVPIGARAQLPRLKRRHVHDP